MLSQEVASKVLETVQSKLTNLIADSEIVFGIPRITVLPENLLVAITVLKEDVECKFDLLLDITAVDLLNNNPRFQIFYQLLSTRDKTRVSVKTCVNEEVSSITQLYHSANFLEREVYDMFGIRFVGHPDLRRILLYDEFVGYPLRKDYPVRGKQPRIQLRYPEVPNSSDAMERPPLADIYVQINKKRPN